MNLLEAVLDANRRRAGGDSSARASLPPGAMPFVITGMDPRIVGNLIPNLGLLETPPPQAKFAGAVVRAGDDACVRSVLAAAILNQATEVIIVGHTDCRMGKVSTGDVRSGIQRLGVRLDAFRGEDPARWLGVFASERASVQSSVEALRAEPRVPPRMPVHGLLFHLESGRLDLVVDGYGAVAASSAAAPAMAGYRPGPMTLESNPSHTFGTPFVPSGPPHVPGPAASIPSATFQMPPPPPFAAPPPPPPMPVPPPPPLAAPAFEHHSLGATRPLDEAPPPPPPAEEPPEPPRPPKGPKRKPGRGSSPFDRANEVLERLRRDQDR